MSENYFYSSLSGQEIEDTLLGAVVFNSNQELTTTQKARARANIGAGEGSTSFKILGFFATLDDLREWLQMLPSVGDAYGISVTPDSETELLSPDGEETEFTISETPYHITITDLVHSTVLTPEIDYTYSDGVITFAVAPDAGTDTLQVAWYDETAPYNVYVWDGVSDDWINNGRLLSQEVIDDNDTVSNKTWSSQKISGELTSLGNTKQNNITAVGMLKGTGSAVAAATLGADYGAKAFQITLESADWSNGQLEYYDQSFVSTGYVYIIDPATVSLTEYRNCGVVACDINTSGKISFSCDITPANDLSVDIIRLVANDEIPSTAVASINVTYPSGATCTCSDGTTTLTATDTSGSFTFDLPNVGSWTVTATNSSGSRSKAVIITSARTSVNISIDYIVPSIYQEVEYIETSGTQYIDLGLSIPASNSSIAFSGKYQYVSDQASSSIWGCQNSSKISPFFWLNANKTLIFLGGNTTNLVSSLAYIFGADREFSASFSGGSYSLNWNGTDYSGSYTQDFPTGLNLYLFANNQNGATQLGKHRLYYWNVSINGVDQRKLHPCYRKSDSVAGLWDSVNDVFYTNAGTGTFTVGSDVN